MKKSNRYAISKFWVFYDKLNLGYETSSGLYDMTASIPDKSYEWSLLKATGILVLQDWDFV